MRGQYEIWVPQVQVPTSLTPLLGLIIPSAAGYVEIVELTVIGKKQSAGDVRFGFAQFTSGAPTLTDTANGITIGRRDISNALATNVTAGARGTAGTAAVWTGTPATYQAPPVNGSFQAFGGRDGFKATLMQGVKIGGTGANSYYDLRGIADAACDCSVRLVFQE